MFDVIAIGDTTQDIFLQMSDASLQCDVDGENCKLCFDYADKIAVEKKTDIPAVGNAANHAIGVSRFGLKSALYTVIGDDAQGQKVDEVLKANNVDTSYVVHDKERGTNLSVVINFKAERTILVYHEPRAYELPEFAKTKWVYLTSASGDGVESLHAQFLKYKVANPDVKLAFNPGTHQMHLGKAALLPLLAHTDFLFMNREEYAQVFEVKTKNIRELMDMYHEVGVKNLVLTDGPEGAYVSDGSKIYFAGVFDGPVVERTGCGDAYGSGFLSAVIQGKSIEDAMQWGNANATSVVQHIGAREGLLEKDTAMKSIEENSHVVPEEYKGEGN